VQGGQTVYNPFPLIGGVAIGITDKNKIIYPNNAK